ncbi:hypothetical protein PK82_26030 [Salmonella enterica subsp. enterica serovar Rubislaw]|nr:hypothetical protein [Salmonella enterica subsp. enterica serovar Rubislaw]
MQFRNHNKNIGIKNITLKRSTVPLLITEKRPRPGPKGRNRVAFNYECCNYASEWLLVPYGFAGRWPTA